MHLTPPAKASYDHGEQKTNMERKLKEGRIRVGPAGWAYPDWEGIVYPTAKPRGFHAASYLAQFFDTIEINSTFYNPPAPDTVRGWVRRIEHNKNFLFTAKLWQRFTHGREASLEDEKTFKRAIEPLAEARRLGAVLMQFPWSFKNTREEREYLAGLCVQFREFPLVVEVRHSSWSEPRTFQMLADLGVGFCNVDQPVIGRSLGPTDVAIPASRVGYVRLHGRNQKHWFTLDENAAERYNYLYTLEELRPWVERIRNVAARTDATFVVTNNHFQGKGVANAVQLVNLLTHCPVRAPESLVRRFPGLAEIVDRSVAPGEARQTDLAFGPIGKEAVR
jgi:uncharacterized protein YecE (DUF72 family)